MLPVAPSLITWIQTGTLALNFGTALALRRGGHRLVGGVQARLLRHVARGARRAAEAVSAERLSNVPARPLPSRCTRPSPRRPPELRRRDRPSRPARRARPWPSRTSFLIVSPLHCRAWRHEVMWCKTRLQLPHALGLRGGADGPNRDAAARRDVRDLARVERRGGGPPGRAPARRRRRLRRGRARSTATTRRRRRRSPTSRRTAALLGDDPFALEEIEARLPAGPERGQGGARRRAPRPAGEAARRSRLAAARPAAHRAADLVDRVARRSRRHGPAGREGGDALPAPEAEARRRRRARRRARARRAGRHGAAAPGRRERVVVARRGARRAAAAGGARRRLLRAAAAGGRRGRRRR